MKPSSEAAALDELLKAMNNPNIPGRELPPEVEEVKGPRPAPPAPNPAPKPAEVTTPIQKLYFTGRLAAGKDHLAEIAGARVFGFADPLYAIARHYLGVAVSSSQGKEIPGVRAFLQDVGQWGRADVSEASPLSLTRSLFSEQIREDGVAGKFGHAEVDWESFGRSPNIWLDAGTRRAEQHLKAHPKDRVAITNCRFPFEFEALKRAGFSHWHVLISPETWTERLATQRLTPESPVVKNVSEQLARAFDAQILKEISSRPRGEKLRCVWCDSRPSPSARLHSAQSFLARINPTKGTQ